MQENFLPDAATYALRNARMGGILTPEQLRAELRHVTSLPRTGSYAVEASVPNWLVEKLDPAKRLAHSYVVFPTLDRLDTLLLATMQCENVQLRCILQLSNPRVKAFLTAALDEKVFTFLFGIEYTRQCAVMGAPMEFDEPQMLLKLLDNATGTDESSKAAMQLTSLSCMPAFVPSLIEGRQVDDVIAVLAGPAPLAYEMADGGREMSAHEKRAATLH